MIALTSVYLGGIFYLICSVFHVFFPKMLDWKHDLPKMSEQNRAAIQIMSLCLLVLFALFSFISLVFAHELVGTALGKTLLASFVVFWIARLVMQKIFIGFHGKASIQMTVFFVTGLTLAIVPLAATVME